MPTCSVNIQPDSIAAKPVIKVLQHLQESFPVSAFRLDYPSTTKQRSHPSRNIQALLMLTGRRNSQPRTNARPASAKPWMQGKAAFVLKNNGFFRTQRFEFFLGPWQTSLRLRPSLEDTYDWLALADTQADASSTGLDGLSALSRTVAVNASPRWDHPSGCGSIRTFGAIPPNDAQAVQPPSASCVLDDLTVFSGSGLLPRPCLPLESSGLHSSGSDPELQRSNPVAAPPALTGGSLSLYRSKLQVLSRPRPATVLWKRFQGRFSYPHHNIKRVKCVTIFTAFVLVGVF